MGVPKKNSEKKSLKKGSSTEISSSISFESAMEELETIVHSLEQDDLTLDEALSNFEQGITLLRTCDTQLHQARGKITELLKGENGAFAEKVLGISLESFLNEDA